MISFGNKYVSWSPVPSFVFTCLNALIKEKMHVVYLYLSVTSCYLGYIPISNCTVLVSVFVSLKELYLIYIAKLRQRIPICFSQGF